MENNKYDLIIVGAGPSGVFTAYELIELGLKDERVAIIGERIRTRIEKGLARENLK